MPLGTSVQLGLRNKFGWKETEALELDVTTVVQHAGAALWAATSHLSSDAWSDVVFPDQFEPRGQPVLPGEYLVYWFAVPPGEERPVFLVCGGFVVTSEDAS